MAGWLTRAAAALRGTEEATPDVFQISCECGTSVAGLRAATHQKITCQDCHRQLIVLPTDPYPRVKRLTTDSSPKAAKTVVQPEERVSPPPAGWKTTKKTKEIERSPARKTAEKSPASAPVPQPAGIDLSPALQQAKIRRRRFRLVVVAIVSLLAVTGWSLHSRSVREQAKLQIPTATQDGLAALHDGHFLLAVQHLSVAVQGLDILHRNDAAAASIRQSHREAVAANQLAEFGLPELAAKALAESPEERERRLQTEVRANWLIFEANLVLRTVDDRPLFELDVPLAVGDRPLNVHCDFDRLRQFAGRAAVEGPTRVVFAGQIAEWIVPSEAAQPVIAKLNSQTAFLWCDYESLHAVGFRPDSAEWEQELRDLLGRQRQVGEAP